MGVQMGRQKTSDCMLTAICFISSNNKIYDFVYTYIALTNTKAEAMDDLQFAFHQYLWNHFHQVHLLIILFSLSQRPVRHPSSARTYQTIHYQVKHDLRFEYTVYAVRRTAYIFLMNKFVDPLRISNKAT